MTEDIEEPEFCPLCFGPAEKCPIYLRPVSRQPLVFCRTHAPTATVETPWFGVSFQAGSLKKSTTSAPSKNHPVVCPVRACQQITWSYNMDAHWTRLHETMDMPPWSFNQPLNSWNVSKVTNMEWMFSGATSFNRPLHAPWYHEESESE